MGEQRITKYSFVQKDLKQTLKRKRNYNRLFAEGKITKTVREREICRGR